jgi:hypothetical protein
VFIEDLRWKSDGFPFVDGRFRSLAVASGVDFRGPIAREREAVGRKAPRRPRTLAAGLFLLSACHLRDSKEWLTVVSVEGTEAK